MLKKIISSILLITMLVQSPAAALASESTSISASSSNMEESLSHDESSHDHSHASDQTGSSVHEDTESKTVSADSSADSAVNTNTIIEVKEPVKRLSTETKLEEKDERQPVSIEITEKKQKEFSGYAKAEIAYLSDEETDALVKELTAENQKAVEEETDVEKIFTPVLPLDISIEETIPEEVEVQDDLIDLTKTGKYTYKVTLIMTDASAIDGMTLVHRKNDDAVKEDESAFETIDFKTELHEWPEEDEVDENGEKKEKEPDKITFETMDFSPYLFMNIEEVVKEEPQAEEGASEAAEAVVEEEALVEEVPVEVPVEETVENTAVDQVFEIDDSDLPSEKTSVFEENKLKTKTVTMLPEIQNDLGGMKLMAVLPQGVAATELPVTADGISIEKASIRWVSSSTGSNTPAKFDDLVLVPGGDVMPNQQWQLDFALSGKGNIAAGDLEIVIPAYIWKDREGNEPGRLTLAIPEEPATNGDFAWKRVGDTYVITNVRAISAGSKYMIQGTFRMTYPDPNSDKPFTTTPAHMMNDIDTVGEAEYKGVSDWLYANIHLVTPHNQEELDVTTNSIRATLNTSVEATSASKKPVNATTPMFVNGTPASLPLAMRPANPDDYYYARWYIAGTANGNQPYAMTLKDNLTDSYGGKILGIVNGDNISFTNRSGQTDIYEGASFGVDKSAYIWVAYPKSSFPEEDTVYTITNSLTVEVRGLDDEVLTTKTTNAQFSFKTPVIWKIDKVWEYNEDRYESTLAERIANRPETTPVWLKEGSTWIGKTVWSDTLSDENNWHTEWTDDGRVRSYNAWEYDQYITNSTHGPNGVSRIIKQGPLGDRVYLPNGSSYQKYWWYDHHKTEYSEEEHRWIFYNDYHEGITWTYPTFYKKYATNHLNDQQRATSDKDLVLLRNDQDTTELSYSVHRTLPIIEYTAKENANYFNASDLHKNTVRLEMVDHTEYFDSRKLSEDEYYFSSVIMLNPTVQNWSPTGSESGTFLARENLAAEMWGRVNGSWVKFAEIDENGILTAFSGATIEGSSIIFPDDSVKQTKLVTKTNGDLLDAFYNVSVRLKPSAAIKERVESLFAVTDYAMAKSRNEATFTLYNDATNVALDEVSSGAATYLHGRNYRLAVDLDKSTTFISNSRVDRNLRWRNTIQLNRVSTISNLSEFNYAVSEGMLADSDNGVFYDLLPAGMRVDESSIKAVSNVNILNVDIIENYQDSGRQLLLVTADLVDVASPITVPYNSAKYNDETYPAYQNQTAYGWKPALIMFDMTYSYDEAKNRGLTGLRNHAAYVADELTFGSAHYWSGEADAPTGDNHKETLNEVRADTRSLLTNLSDSNGPNTVYAGADARLTEVDFSALTDIVKHVSITGSDVWSYGHDNEVNVAEGGKYSYRITLTSGTDTTTKNIIILDSLETYVPMEVTDAGDSDQEVGKILSRREFDYINEILESSGLTQMQGQPAWAWKGYFRGIDVSEIRTMGIDAKVYYATGSNLDIESYNNDHTDTAVPAKLSDTSIWSLTPPSDLSTVTGIAIDCRKTTDGEDFELKENEGLIAYVHMKAPTYDQQPDAFGEEYQNFLENAHAFNNVYMDVTQVDELGSTTHSYDHFDYTQVGIYGMDVKVVKVWDDENDNDRIRPADLEVELLANGEPTGRTKTLSEATNWEGVFDHVLEFDDNDSRIAYSIEESVPDYTSSYKKETDGNLTTITATNTHELYTTEYPFEKEWWSLEPTGWENNIPASLTVRLYADGVFTGKTMIIRPDEDGNWSGIFKDLQKFKDGELIDYSVQEVVPNSNWIDTYDGNLIRNQYYPYGDLKLTKKVIGSTTQSKDSLFHFTIVLKDASGEGLVEEYAYTITDAEDVVQASGNIGNGGEFDLKENWTFELKDVPSGARYEFIEDTKAGYVLTGKTRANGSIVAGTPQEAQFTNTYNTTGSIGLEGTKTLSGREIQRSQFRFELYENDTLLRTASNRADGSFVFGNINYGLEDNEKEFTYTIRETNRGRAGYTYDDTVYKIKTYPVDNGDGTMSVTRRIFKVTEAGCETCGGTGILDPMGETPTECDVCEGTGHVESEESVDSLDFANAYHAEGEIVLKAWKELQGRTLANEEFEFELLDENGTVIDTKKNAADGSIVFDAVEYDETDVGTTYYYAIREKAGSDATVNYDENVYGYSVTVYDNGDGTLSCTTWTVDVNNLFIDTLENIDSERFFYEEINNSFSSISESSRFFYWDKSNGQNCDKFIACLYGLNTSVSEKNGGYSYINYLPYSWKPYVVQGFGYWYQNDPTVYYSNIKNPIIICKYWDPQNSKNDSYMAWELANSGSWNEWITFLEDAPNNYSFTPGGNQNGLIVPTNEAISKITIKTILPGEIPRLIRNPNYDAVEGELPVFRNTLKPGSLSVSKHTENGGDPDQEFRFKVKLIGEGLEDGIYTLDKENLPYNITLTYDAAGGEYQDGATTNTLTYLNRNDGSVPTQTLGEYEEPTRDGSRFDGWYTDAEYTTEWNTNTIPNGDKTVYAKWVQLPKYAVSIYGIGVDKVATSDAVNTAETADGTTAVVTRTGGLTFGPALGANYISSYKNHEPTGATSSGNAHRCVHDDDWNTIIEWNNEDPFVYEQCVSEGCTHSVGLDIPETLANNQVVVGTGDGPSMLYNELLLKSSSTTSFENLRWHPNNNMPNDTSDYGTNYGGWGAARIRAMLNGADALTDIGDGTAAKAGGTDIYASSASSDINKSAAVYTTNNRLFAAFPSELQQAIGPRATKYDSVYNSKTAANLKTSYDKLWLLSPNEMGLASSVFTNYQHPLEADSVYDKFAGQSLTTSVNTFYVGYRNNNGSGATGGWWLRSLDSTYPYGVFSVYTGGSVYNGLRAHTSDGVAPAFTLKTTANIATITYDANGGTAGTVETYFNKNLVSAAVTEPTRTDYVFDGWCTDAAGTIPFDISTWDGSDITLYAKWKNPPVKYAVSVYGIGVDQVATSDVVNTESTANGTTAVATEIAGLTFGPAIGGNYVTTEKPAHVTLENETANDMCIHNHSWDEIVAQNDIDPHAFDGCVSAGCTKTIELEIPVKLAHNAVTQATGDGPGVLYHELLWYGSTTSYENLRWHPNNNMPNNTSPYGTNYGGWGAARLRAVLNGADALTDMGDGTAAKEGGTDIYSSLASSDFNKSAAANTTSNRLLAAFPAELQAAIAPRAVKYDSVYNSKTAANLRTSYDKLWLLSPNEMGLASSVPANNQHPLEADGVYEKFSGQSWNTSNTFYRGYRNNNGSGSTVGWWLRSSYGDGANKAMYVSETGYVGSHYAYYYYGVAPCFTLRSG